MSSYDDYDSYEREMAIKAKHRPHCQVCGEAIWKDECYMADKYLTLCDACFDEWFEENIDEIKGEYRRNVD